MGTTFWWRRTIWITCFSFPCNKFRLPLFNLGNLLLGQTTFPTRGALKGREGCISPIPL